MIRTSTNSYAKPHSENYYRSGKPSDRFNVDPEHRLVNLIEDVVDEGLIKDENWREYDGSEYAQENGERVSCMVKKVICAASRPNQ